MSSSDALSALTERLEHAAARLRENHLSPDEAADLVEECARLAAEATSALEREARGAPLAAGPGESRLFEPPSEPGA